MTEHTMRAFLKAIARGEYNDLSGDPTEWASTLAYFGLGGRIKDGQRIDDVENLPHNQGA